MQPPVVPSVAAPSPAPAGYLALINRAGRLITIDANGVERDLQDDSDVLAAIAANTYDGEPTNYSAPSPAVATHSTATYTGAGAAGSLVLTTRDPYAGSNDYDLVLVDPLIESQALALEDSVATKTCTVYLATDAGSTATATLSNGTVATHSTAGSVGNESTIILDLQKQVDMFGVSNVFPNQDLSAVAASNGKDILVRLATGTGTQGTITLTESSSGAGELTVVTTTQYAGSWGNGKVRAMVQFSGVSSPFSVAVTPGASTYDIVVDLATDADGLPVDATSTAVVAAINSEMGIGELEAFDSTPGTAQSATTTIVAAGGVTTAGYATAVVTGALVTASPITIPVALDLTDTTATAIAAKVRAAVAVAGITGNYNIDATANAAVKLTTKAAVHAANDVTLDITIANGVSGVTAAPSSANTQAGVVDTTPQVETATVAGTANYALSIPVTVTGTNVGNSPKTIMVAIVKDDNASAIAGKIRTALNVADITTGFTVGGAGAEVSLTSKTNLADDGTLNIAIGNGNCAGITSNTKTAVAGVATGVFNTYQAWAAMAGGVDAAGDDLKNTAALIEAKIGETGLATATGGSGAISVYESVDFSGGGTGVAITTTLTQLKAALNAVEGGSAIIIAGAIANGSTLCTDSTTTLTGGKDIGEDAAEVLGTPGRLGRKANDGTDEWTAMKNDNTTTQDGWVKTFSGGA